MTNSATFEKLAKAKFENTANEIFDFIEETLEKSESVLVHSVKGQSRASAVIAIYLMK